MLTCCTCEESGFNRNTLEMHIATAHIFYNAYECEHCKTALFPSEFALRQHYQQDHRQNLFYIRFRVTPELEKKREVLETLIRKSLANSSRSDGDDGNNRGEGTNMNDTTPGFIPNIDHLEASQLLSCIQAGPATSGSSFSALLKYDVDESDAGDGGSVNDSILARNGEIINAYGGCPYSSASTTATGKAVTAVQGLLSINGNGIQVDPLHQSQVHHSSNQSSHQIHLQNGLSPQFLQVQPPPYGDVSDALTIGDLSGGALTDNGPDLLVKLLNVTKSNNCGTGAGDASTSIGGTRRHHRDIVGSASPTDGAKRPPRISSQIACVECGIKVSNYMNSLVLHVSTHHCNMPVYECRACGKQWFSLSARFKDHIKSRHDGDMSFFKDNRRSIMPLLKEKAMALFPDHRFS